MTQEPKRLAGALAIVAITLPLYLAGQRSNPPGFYNDESSVAWNALSIARSGADEYGRPFPLFFRAFGEYKNPVYIYLLAGVFKVFGPETLVARRTSAILGYLAAVAIGGLAFCVTRRLSVALAVFLIAITTPALFEVTRLAFEVAVYPLAVALFLLAAWCAHQSERWGSRLVAAIVGTLALVTYSYTAGRLHGPAFAALLFLFATRTRLARLAAALGLYVLVALVPMGVFELHNPEALGERTVKVSYIAGVHRHPLKTLVALERNLAANLLPAGMALRGDPRPRHHVPRSGGSIAIGTFLLAAASLVVLGRRGFTRFWILVAAGTLLAVMPCAATREVYHTLRLAAYPVFLIVLSIPALEAAAEGRSRPIRIGAGLALVLGLAQAAFFFARFHRDGAKRAAEFDAGARRTMTKAVARPERPIFVLSGPDQAHAHWFGELLGAKQEDIVSVPELNHLPPGSLVFTSREPCDGCLLVTKNGAYAAYLRP